jgi:hypothetical protein
VHGDRRKKKKRRRRRRREREAIGNCNEKWVALEPRTWITRCLVAFSKSTKRAQGTSLTTGLALRSSSCVGGVAMTLIRLSMKFSQGSHPRNDSVWPTGPRHQDLASLLWRMLDGQVVMVVLVEIPKSTIEGHRKKEAMMPSLKGHSMMKSVLISTKCPGEYLSRVMCSDWLIIFFLFLLHFF